MEYRVLGLSGLRVSAIGLGCMGMSHAYGTPADKKEMTELLALAVDMGYTFFDTAEVYGTSTNPHDNEELLGNALKAFRDKIVIASKFGLTFDKSNEYGPYPLILDSKPKNIRIAVEGSLTRLKTDHLDLYYQHRIDPDVEPEHVAATMADLIREGKILHWGVSEADEDYIRRAHKVCPITAIQNRYSMMARWHESLFPTLEELGIGFVAFSPLANGLLSACYDSQSIFNSQNDYRATMPQFKKESFETNKPLLNLINLLADQHHATPAQISLAWMLQKRPWIVPIPGTRHLCRLKENAGAVDIKMNPNEINQIDRALDNMDMSEVFGGAKKKSL
ncbi:aldo/keto reductase [Parabacteroides sp.]